jgi:MoaA/NifB/PqqE/SkfB family radical SAM enzyme
MSVANRVLRHARLSWGASRHTPTRTPPFLIFFINSICNLKCEHCFYWQHLNKRDDLSFDEIVALSRELDEFENLNLSGGEPFMRKEFAEICLEFIERNGVKQIYVPTNGYYTEKTIAALEKVLSHDRLQLFACEISLDGMQDFHNEFRGNPRSFQKAMETYDALAELQKRDPRLRIHSIATVTDTNVEEIRRLTTFLFQRCPQMDHHNIALIRGDRKNASLQGPALAAYEELYAYARRLWAPRETGRFGASVDPMLTWAKVKTARERRMVVPCRAGWLSAVVNANGDVALCETEHTHPPVGNLREKSFRELWWSPQAEAQREEIRNRRCHCTNEVFLWPSVAFQPTQLVRAAVGARLWERPSPLEPGERAPLATPTGAES